MIFEYENLGQPFLQLMSSQPSMSSQAIYTFPILWTMSPLKYSGKKNSFDLVPVLFGGIPALYHLEKEERTD